MPGLSGGTGSAPLPLSREAARRAGLGPLRHVVETGSTNRDLAAEARRGEVGAGLLVADRQTAGRGRLDRRWRDAPGRSLLASFRLPSLASEPFGPTAAVTAAARAAAAALLPVPVLSKWPNDLVIDDRPAPGKLAGVLSELVDEESTALEISLRAVVNLLISGGVREIPQHVIAKVDQRIEDIARRNPAIDPAGFPTLSAKLEHFDLQDIQEVIVSRAHWDKFRFLFRRKETFEANFVQLTDLRNAIRHTRTVDEVTLKGGDYAVAWFKSALKRLADRPDWTPPDADPKEN